MHFRRRADSLTLERSIYVPAVLAADGKTIIEPARRTTKFLGTVPSNARYADVPAKVLDVLTAEERTQLWSALRHNEPASDAKLSELPANMAMAGEELIALARRDPSPEGIAQLRQRWRALEEAWAALQHDAQVAGVRRKSPSKRSTPSAE